VSPLFAAEEALFEVQAAIVALLRADVTLSGLVNLIGDEIPKNTDYPYVQLGDEATGAPWHTHNRPGEEIVFPVDIYSDRQGFRQAQVIAKSVMRLLANQSFAVSGYKTATSYYDSTRQAIEENEAEEKRRRITLNFRVRLLQADPS